MFFIWPSWLIGSMRGFACIIHYLVGGSVASQSLFQLHGTRISPQLSSTNGRDRPPNTAEAPQLQWRGPQLSWKVRSARNRTRRNIQIGVRSESFQNSGIFARKFKNHRNFQHFLKYRRNSDKFHQHFHQNLSKITEKNSKITKFCKIMPKDAKKFDEEFLKYWCLSGAKACKSCRSRQELSNEYLLAKFKILPKNAKKFDENFLKYWGLSGAKACKSCRSRQELSN